MEDIVIVSAARTAVGKFGGSLAKVAAPELGSIAIRAALERAKLAGDQVGEVIMGQVLAAGSGQNPARQAVIKAGLPQSVPGLTINAVCGSGLKAVMLAYQAVLAGDSEIVVAGGQENMSASPHVLMGSRDGQRMGDWKMVDTMINDGLWDVYNKYHMGITAENVARQEGITRDMQDALALASQQKAAAAQAAGKFKDEIVPVTIPQRKGAASPTAWSGAAAPPLAVLQNQGFQVALVTDGRMSGASGKVPAAIHVTPEALAGGPLAKVRDGDIVRVDAVAGTLDVLVDEAEWAARVPAPYNHPSQTGFGRELFANFRRHAGGAEQGACTWL